MLVKKKGEKKASRRAVNMSFVISVLASRRNERPFPSPTCSSDLRYWRAGDVTVLQARAVKSPHGRLSFNKSKQWKELFIVMGNHQQSWLIDA